MRIVLEALEKAQKNGLLGSVSCWTLKCEPRKETDWSINQIILDIKPLTSLFCSVEFDYIPRALNGHAHKLAKFCYFARQDVETWTEMAEQVQNVKVSWFGCLPNGKLNKKSQQ